MSFSNLVRIIFTILFFGMQGSALLLDDDCLPVTTHVIIGGKNAAPAPWMAYLMKEGKFICGGTLVSHSFALTAAHCAISTDKLIVRLGEYNTSDNKPAESYQVSSIISHSKRDIALLKFHTEVKYSEYIKPICILSSTFYKKLPPINNFFVTGWGATSDLDKRSSSTVLQQMSAKRMHPPECKDQEGDICCGNASYEQFICGGDSGSPLVAYVRYNESTTILAQYGVVSTTSDLCRDHAYYVDVNELSEWIFHEVKTTTFKERVFKIFDLFMQNLNSSIHSN